MPDYVVYVALLVISIAYNEIVAADADDNGGDSPYTAYFVAGGFLYIIGAAYLIDGLYIHVVHLLLCCVFAGLPMILGSMSRHKRKKKKARLSKTNVSEL